MLDCVLQCILLCFTTHRYSLPCFAAVNLYGFQRFSLFPNHYPCPILPTSSPVKVSILFEEQTQRDCLTDRELDRQVKVFLWNTDRSLWAQTGQVTLMWLVCMKADMNYKAMPLPGNSTQHHTY